MVMNLNQAYISPHRWQETIHMVRQELQPVHPTSKFGLHCIIFEDIEIRTALNKKMDQFWYYILKTKLTVFLEVAGRGYTTRLKWNSNAGTLAVGKSNIVRASVF